MHLLYLLLTLAAVVLFCLAGFFARRNAPTNLALQFIAFGLAFWVTVDFIRLIRTT